jgi:hypothetical protein
MEPIIILTCHASPLRNPALDISAMLDVANPLSRPLKGHAPPPQYLPLKPIDSADRFTVHHPSPLDIQDRHFLSQARAQISTQQELAHQHLWTTQRQQHRDAPMLFTTSGPVDDDEFGLGFGNMQPYEAALGGGEEDGWGVGGLITKGYKGRRRM